ncbi:MAG: hypothetical protein GC191_14455 [Azospirillum sp.]|nr:hypothetical protein [Azospirillum sp.]
MADNLLTAIPVAAGAAAGPNAGEPATPPPGGRPSQVPEKFWDAKANAIRVDALLKSYLELERRLSRSGAGSEVGGPSDPTQLRRVLGVPDSPEGYRVACPHGLFAPDAKINQRLHGAGFAPAQAQLVYDLAAEHFIPMIRQIAGEYEADRQLQRLVEHFGGEDKWREVSRQMLAWGRKNLPAAAIDGLATTAEGVIALHRLMTGAEPVTLRGTAAQDGTGEAELQALMRDPRYWRDRDPALVAKVTEGYKRLYPVQN